MASGSAATSVLNAREVFTLSGPAVCGFASYTVNVSWGPLLKQFLAENVTIGSEARLWLRDRGPGPDGSGVSFLAALMREVPVPGLAELAPEECPDGLLPAVRRACEALPWVRLTLYALV